MEVFKYEKEFGVLISFHEFEKQLDIFLSNNLDLYWIIRSKTENVYHDFIITKENYGVYRLFEELFDDIKNKKVYADSNISFNMGEYEQDCFNQLFDRKNNIITWYSDETNHEVANILKIKKENELFRLEFYMQLHKKNYDRDFNSLNYISIRFRNSGSLYAHYNVIFMRMYEKMKQIDNINDYGHQIHIEEYLYSQNKIKKLAK